MAAGSIRVVLLAGPSGSGKSRLAGLVGATLLRLDDFYLDADAPGLPRAHGIVDWDDPATWDAAGAVEAVRSLLGTGRAVVPRHSISASRRTGTHVLEVAPGGMVVAEGIFAIELLPHLRAAGVAVEPLYLDRSPALVALLRFRHDVAERRKSVPVLVRRGWSLLRSQSALRRRALDAGFRPVTMREAVRLLTPGRGA